MPNKHVLIVEPAASGHRMVLYVRHVLRALHAEGCEVSLLTTKSAVAHPGFELVKAECPREMALHYLPELPSTSARSAVSLFAQQLRSWTILRREFLRVASEVRPDVVYVPTLDWIAKALEVFGSPFGNTPFVGLYMSPKHHRNVMGLGPSSRQDWLYDRLFQRLLHIPSLRNILVIDEVFVQFCQSRYGPGASKVQYVPDFGEIRGEASREDCRKELGIAPDTKVLLVYGSLTSRKGIVELLRALENPNAPPDILILLAGVASEEITSLLETPGVRALKSQGKILPRLFFHGDADEYRVFRAADFVWLGYAKGFYGSSGVLYQAVAARLPVVAMEQGLIGYLVRKHKLGVTVNTNRGSSIISGLREILNWEYNQDRGKRRLQSFAAIHDSASHAEAVLSALLPGKVEV